MRGRTAAEDPPPPHARCRGLQTRAPATKTLRLPWRGWGSCGCRAPRGTASIRHQPAHTDTSTAAQCAYDIAEWFACGVGLWLKSHRRRQCFSWERQVLGGRWALQSERHMKRHMKIREILILGNLQQALHRQCGGGRVGTLAQTRHGFSRGAR